MIKTHSFHIPVMGIGYTIDTPLKVSQYGINSVISLVDDILLEKIRKFYCNKNKLIFNEISDKEEDFRAKRITSYLNLINSLAEKKFEEIKNSAVEKSKEIKEYFSMLPENSTLKKEFKELNSKNTSIEEIKNWIKKNLYIGSIDVNIMTKADKDNFKNDVQLPVEFNDAHAALRGFANSNLKSSIILSAGMNTRLYGYFENFEDFYPDQKGEMKKKIVLKVSDYRSAFIQGQFLAKKGLWVSEYRIESGLNCGGHAFATEGFLLGPILAQFRDKREELYDLIYQIYIKALCRKKIEIPKEELKIKITAQGGVGTAEEHQFLLDHYNLDSIGWGSPFLLVPEVTNVDELTIKKLIEAKEEDLYLSNISPLGVPFNNLKGNTKDMEKFSLISKGRPGSSCPKKYVELNNKEFTERSICTASRQYQNLKLKELEKENLSSTQYKEKFEKIVEKSCICVGLGTSALLVNNLDTSVEGEGVSVCPGPNIAYFSRVTTLQEMIDHIYGRNNIITREDRPHLFIKELKMYIEFLKSKVQESEDNITGKQVKYLTTFAENLKEGINYYLNLFEEIKVKFEGSKNNFLNELESNKNLLSVLEYKIKELLLKSS